jgi:hypothetical protein
MNTRATLRRQFAAVGMRETLFRALGDTRSTGRWRLLNTAELALWRALDAVGIVYPEHCLLGVYTNPG